MVELLTAQGGGVGAICGQLKVTAKSMKDYNSFKKSEPNEITYLLTLI